MTRCPYPHPRYPPPRLPHRPSFLLSISLNSAYPHLPPSLTVPIPAVCLYSVHTHSLHTISLKNHLPKPPPSHHLLASEHPSIKPNSMPAPNKGKWLPRPLLGSDGPSGVWEILGPPAALVCLEGKFWACRLLSFLVKEHFDTSRLAPPNFYRLQGFPSIQFKDNL